jgi:hypothetical protein
MRSSNRPESTLDLIRQSSRPFSSMELKEHAQREWNGSPSLRLQFGTFDRFLAGLNIERMAHEDHARTASGETELKARAKWDWDHDPSLRADFPSLGSYYAFKKAEAAGRIRIIGMKRISA